MAEIFRDTREALVVSLSWAELPLWSTILRVAVVTEREVAGESHHRPSRLIFLGGEGQEEEPWVLPLCLEYHLCHRHYH